MRGTGHPYNLQCASKEGSTSRDRGTMEMELISRETIKPSSPTPPHLKIYPLSFMDHIIFRNYVPLLSFYPSKVQLDQTSKVSMLKKSLSQVLSRYYPFAGRFRDQLSIDCNDQGVSLLVAQIRIELSTILQNPLEATLSPLFPDELQWKDMDSNTGIVAIQINCFLCGGIAISVCMSHKVGDASTLFSFVNDWAKLNTKTEEENELAFPVLDIGASVFPQGDLPVFPEQVFVKQNSVCRRFVFEASKIESLKAMVTSHNKVRNPSRVEVVTALIYKRAASALRLTSKTTTLFRVAVNLRARMVPPLPERSIGNVSWFMLVSNRFINKREEEAELELHDLVSKMKEGLSEFRDKYARKFGAKDLLFISECLKQATSSYSYPFRFSSWCRFPLYEADFGWGKPIWVTTSGCPLKNCVILMDTRDGNGIEALVNMKEQDMALFEHDVELLQYASLDPPIGCADGS